MATLKIEHFGSKPRNDQAYIADRNLYLDEAGNLVEEDNVTQVKQLVGKGGALSTDDANKYGLLKKAKAAKEEAEEVDGGEKASSPSANKAVTPAKNKGAK